MDGAAVQSTPATAHRLSAGKIIRLNGLSPAAGPPNSEDEQLAVLRMLEGPFRDRAARLITHTFPLPQAEDGFTLYDSLTTGIIAIDCTQADGLR